MSTGIIITLIICGTILAVTIIGILFAMWVINKGMDLAKERRS